MVQPTDIKNAYLRTSNGHETASGTIILVYADENEEKTYVVNYDTVIGSDGLDMTVTDKPNDRIKLENGGFEKVPEFVIKHANETLYQYYNEAKYGKNVTPQGNVVFTDIVGANDNWYPKP